MPAVPEVEFGPEEQKDLFEVFYRKHKPADVEDSVAMAAKLTADKGFGKIRKALTKKYGDDPLPLWRAAKKAREAAGGKGGGAQGEPEPEPEEEEEEEEEKLPRVIPEGHHQLSATWVAWAQKAPEPGQKRGEAFPIGDFATVEEFWTSWRWVPSPSKAFNQMHRPARERVPVVSLAVFKDGIEPKRKHKANERGGMWASIQIARRGEPPSDVLENGLVDDLWNNLIYGCIGETIDAGDEITGARVVDQRRENRGVVLELWFRNFAKKDEVKRLQGEMERTLIDGHPAVTGQPQVQFECLTWRSNMR